MGTLGQDPDVHLQGPRLKDLDGDTGAGSRCAPAGTPARLASSSSFELSFSVFTLFLARAGHFPSATCKFEAGPGVESRSPDVVGREGRLHPSASPPAKRGLTRLVKGTAYKRY